MPLPLSSCLLRRLPVVVLGFVLNLALAACGSDKSAPPPAEPGPLKSGMFADHPVEGLEFSSGGAPVSLTDRQGTFSYRDGAPVSFAIGGIALGSEVAGAVTVTPLQLAPGAADTTDPRVTNMARLLQTLDADCDVSNGIRLTPAVRSAGSGRSIDFDQTEAAFGSDTAVQNFLEAAGAGCRDTAAPDNGLVSGALARQRLGETLTHMESNGGRANRLPVALAGADFQVNEGAVASLAGAGADDDGSVPDSGYRWTQLSGPAVISGPVLTASFNFAAPAVEADTPVTLRLRVTDDDDGTHDDDLTITIRNGTVNDRPIADAGADQTVNETETVTLNGANSRDPEDGVNISYQWTQDPDDPVAVTLSGADGPTPTFTAPVVAAQIRLHFTLIVRDSQNLASAPNTVTITVNNVVGVAPVADAGPDRMVDEGAAVTLDGTDSTDSTDSTDPDGSITGFDWTQTAGAPVMLTGANTATPSFVAPDVVGDEDLTFRLTVTDNHGDTDNDSVTVRVLDRRVISIGSPAPVIEGDVGLTEVSFTVRLTLPAVNPVTVEYTTQDVTATAGRDYVAASGTLEFQAGEDEKTVTVNVIGDVFDENDETFRVLLFDATGASLGASAGTGTILDDDDKGLLRAGAAKRSITPCDQEIAGVCKNHIAGVDEPRIDGTTHLQRFHLGGFGTEVTQNVPDPIASGGRDVTNALADAFGENNPIFTVPAEEKVFTGSRGPEDTHVRVMVVEDQDADPETEGDQPLRVAFVTIDAIGAGNIIQRDLKAAVMDATKLCDAAGDRPCFEPENILFGQTHSHAGADLQGLWGGVPQDWIENILYERAAEAVADAIRNLRPARLGLRQDQTLDYNSHRRQNLDGDDEADGTLTLLTATADDGTRVGSILQYNAHPTTINDGDRPRRPHADYIQGAMDWLESEATGPGGVGLYYNGPIADARPSCPPGACPNGSPDGKFTEVRLRGEGIASTALSFDGARELLPTLGARHELVVLPVTNPLFLAAGLIGSFNRYYDFLMLPKEQIEQIPTLGPLVAAEIVNLPQLTPVATTNVSRITIGGATGGLEVVTIPGEATNTFGQYIRGLATTDVMLLGLTQNSFGYIIPEEEFNYLNPGHLGDENDAFSIPFTSYEEFVSLGPLTAPLLQLNGYNPLFGIAECNAAENKFEGCNDPRNLPPSIRACMEDPLSEDCALSVIGRRIDFIQRANAQACRNFGGAQAEPICALIDPETPFFQQCLEAGLPEDTCRVFGTGNPDTAAEFDQALSVAAADALARGCDILDPAHCLFPFPNDHFTVRAAAGSPQHELQDGTGRRVNLSPLATPRNTAGKPIDPTEWNRNDGFSPGQMIVTYVPGIAVEEDGRIKGAVSLRDLASYDDRDAPIFVIDTATGARHPVWAEIDLTAETLLYLPIRQLEDAGFSEDDDVVVPRNGPVRAPVIIRPAVNFTEGRRYIVALRNLENGAGHPIAAQAGFRVCRDGLASELPPVQDRCAHIDDVIDELEIAEEARFVGHDFKREELFLAWDFTVASTDNTIGRLRHMRDDAFVNYLGEQDDTLGNIVDLGRPPQFEVTEVIENPAGHLALEIRGRFTVPSYVTPADPSPADGSEAYQELLQRLPPEGRNFVQSGGIGLFEPAEVSSPPNRLFYLPDETSATACDSAAPEDSLRGRCLEQARFGDGLPDRSGELTTTFTCRVAKSTVSNNPFVPARPSLYGHGLLGNTSEMNQDQLRQFGDEHNMMFCGTDWFGFASGDLPNVALLTLDISNFPTLPDGTQQGILNQMFLARLLRHPQGFASHSAFQLNGRPLFDNREVFYDGNSQGGITGGAVIAASKDVNRGVLGVPGMNYSTLLTRSVDFDLFSVPLYASYTSELDRNLIFAMMQMLWDRSENNGYAAHLANNNAFAGPPNRVLLHPAFGDHQVTNFSADVMARTIGAPVDRSRISAARQAAVSFEQVEPDQGGLAELTYTSAQAGGSGLVYWDAPWTSDREECKDQQTAPQPIGNVPPRHAGADPHECPRREVLARCQKSRFLHTNGVLTDADAAEICTDLPPPDTTATVGLTNPEYGTGLFALLAEFMVKLGDFTQAVLVGNVEAAWAAFMDALASVVANLQSMLVGDDGSLLAAIENAAGNFEDGDPQGFLADFLRDLGAIVGLQSDPVSAAQATGSAQRSVEPVVVTGAALPGWSQPAAAGVAHPYPSGAIDTGAAFDPFHEADPTGQFPPGQVRNAHNGKMLHPAGWTPGAPAKNFGGVPVEEIAAYRYAPGASGADDNGFVEIPVQVDERMPYFLANANSDFSIYSGTDPELTYAWDTEGWGMTKNDPENACARGYDPNGWDTNPGSFDGNTGISGPVPDPVKGLDNDDEIVFMAQDAGARAPFDARPAGVEGIADAQEIALLDPLLSPGSGQPNAPKFVYLFRKAGGSSFDRDNGYVRYRRDRKADGDAFDADQWIDRNLFHPTDPEKLGTRLTNYGPNIGGTVCVDSLDQYHGNDTACSLDGATGKFVCPSTDRFPRDGVTVSTGTYRWKSSGRWMVRDIRVAPCADADGDPANGCQHDFSRSYDWSTAQQVAARPDLVDRWKGRAFQQNPDSYINLIGGFEEEQSNWEANSTLLGERSGPVRSIRETWGADSGTNVTKTETFYRDAVAYRYHVRVHPIPTDGLYTSWDYNRIAMVPTPDEAASGVPGGRYFTQLRPQGVPVDGINDDVGQVDGVVPFPGDLCFDFGEQSPADPRNGQCPMYFDAADPTFNLALGFYNWEQVSGKGDLGSLVYLFEVKGETSYLNPLVVPYYRDDACFDDGTGDDPARRRNPGSPSTDAGVQAGYTDANGNGRIDCEERQGAHGSHGIHYFFTHDTDNAFSPVTSTETDGQQWQFMVPTDAPTNIGEPYANVVRAPLKAVAIPRGGEPAFARELFRNYPSLLACVQAQDSAACEQALMEILTRDQVTACQPKVTNPGCVIGPAFSAALMALDDANQPPPHQTAPVNGVYDVYIPSESGEIIAFTVFEPTTAIVSGQVPLVLHGHGYGGSRTRSRGGVIQSLNNAGYAVISFDQRGFGESSGTVRVIDPDVEGRDMVRMVDWAEANLPWLKYESGNLVLGSIGGSYGGGFQLMLAAVDPRRRLDALVPDITWNDLRSSLNPGRVVKSGWDLLLPVGGESGSQGQQDPFIKESLLQGVATNGFPADSLAWFNYHSLNYFCEADGELDHQQFDPAYDRLENFPGAGTARVAPPAVDVLLTQGMRDTLFNFNQAYANYRCLSARGGDVRLSTHQGGHILPVVSPATSGSSCAGRNATQLTLAWFDEKLKGNAGAASAIPEICLSTGPSQSDVTDQASVTVGGTAFEVPLTRSIPNGFAALPNANSGPTVIELGTITTGGAVLAGIPTAQLTIAHPVNNHPLADPILFVGLGFKKPGQADWTLIDDQVQPVRGTGGKEFQLVGVAERLAAGDQLALLVSGFHQQYPESWSRDITTPAVNLSGVVKLPILAGGEMASAAAVSQSLVDCLQNQDIQACAALVPNLAARLQACSLEDFADIRDQGDFEDYAATQPNCAFNALYDAVGVDDAAAVLDGVLDRCNGTPAEALCEQIAQTGGAPDRLPLAAELLDRGDLVVADLAASTPSAKTVNGDPSDWMGAASRIGGTARFDTGEHIYNDYVFDAYGADDGNDVRRLAVTLLLAEMNGRTGRIDQLFQAGGDQFGAPAPVGAPDHYGDTADLEDGLDLSEVRWASDGGTLFMLARTTRLMDANKLVLLVLADTQDNASGMAGLNAGLATSKFDRALVLRNSGSRFINLTTGASAPLTEVAVSAAGYNNALEAALPVAALATSAGRLRVAVMTARDNGDGSFTPVNVAYRFDEPVAGIFNDQQQALALFHGNVDGFTADLAVSDLVSGRTQSARPGAGYHERQFVSGDNISAEDTRDQGRLQHYGLYVPASYTGAAATPLTFWLHYRGGKAHSGGAWTPRLIKQLSGEDETPWAPEPDSIVVTPRGRGTSTWYTNWAHQDVFEVFADVAGTDISGNENLPGAPTITGLLNVDASGVYLSGYSMGGYGTYLFGLLYPDKFAAGYSTSGAVTQGLWTGFGPDHSECTRPPQSTPEGDANLCFGETDRSSANAQLNFRILENARHFPIVIHHGTDDELVPISGVQHMGARLLELGYRYDLTMFFGYEHFTQAIVDEWADGAHYLKQFARPANPRQVTYKVVPALVKAVREVQVDKVAGPGRDFSFINPDGAYWVDGLAVRPGAPSGFTNSVADFGMIDAESEAIAAEDHAAVPTSQASFLPPYLSTPVFSPGGHSTPYARHGQSWRSTTGKPVANRFSATLTKLSAATLDLARMNLSFAQNIRGSVTSDGAAALTLARVGADMTLCAGSAPGVNVAAGANAVANLLAGSTDVLLAPGHNVNCADARGFVFVPGEAPDAAALCGSFGIDDAAPLCGALVAAETGLNAQCQDGGGAELCTLSGGNLHAVLDACYVRDPSAGEAPVCSVVDSFVEGAAAYCRQFSTASGGAQPPEVCALIGGVLVSEGALQRYEESWTHRALSLQNKLGYGLPLLHNTLLHTHNSFNATDDNTPPTLSGSDYNQLYDITGQLRMDIRAIEIDVHWMPGRDGTPETGGFEPTVCHADTADNTEDTPFEEDPAGTDHRSPHLGCTVEKPLREVLEELRFWLDQHPSEAVVLYLEDHLTEAGADTDVSYDTTSDVIEETLGDLVYRTGTSDCDNADPTSWLKNVTRREIIETGMQVFLISETCNSAGTWNSLVHRKRGDNVRQGTQSSFAGFSYEANCALPDDAMDDGIRIPDQRGVRWSRIWEDSTMVTATAGGGAPAALTPAVTHELMRCGLSLPGFDRLYPADQRLDAAVWSWAKNEPAADAAHANNCAKLNTDGRFEAANCDEERPYACVAGNLADGITDPNDWEIVGSGMWEDGAAACIGKGRLFSVPASGYANEQLKAAAGGAEIWLNYTDAATEGDWQGHQVGGVALRGTTGFRTAVGLRNAVAAFLASIVSAVAELADASFDTFPAAIAGALNELASNLFAVLVGNGPSSLWSLVQGLMADVEQMDSDNVARDLLRGLGRIVDGGTSSGAGYLRAGVGVVDMTPDVGYGTGQHGRDGTDRFDGFAGEEMDPFLLHKLKGISYGVQSRLTARAIVVEGANGKRIALVKTDNYLAQDTLVRRVAQILVAGTSGIGYDQILYHVTHDHSSAYNSTPAAGVWAFQDAFDPRFFENQARKMAEAIELAAANLKPARMGAIEVKHTIFKGNVVGPATADDGTPAGYPLEYGDHGLVVMRFDEVDANGEPFDPARPIAVWVNWGEHPESLSGDGLQLHSADFLAPLERFVERDIGAPLVFSQGDVGSSEREGNKSQRLDDEGNVCESSPTDATCQAGGVLRSWHRRTYVQVERNVRYLADSIRDAWLAIGTIPADSTEARKVQLSRAVEVNYVNAWVPGPLSHPYPAVSNCRSQPSYSSDPGSPVLGLPECARASNGFGGPGEIDDSDGGFEDQYEEAYQDFMDAGPGQAFGELATIVGLMHAEGVPIPDHYDAISFGTVEENARLKLQVFQLGDVVLASCACEAQVDLILNLESRLDQEPEVVYDGFDWACYADSNPGDENLRLDTDRTADLLCTKQLGYYSAVEFPTRYEGSFDDSAGHISRMRAQVHNPADGWDAPEYVPFANSEPDRIEDIKGNFTHEEIQDLGATGFRLPVGIGHAGDYNGYTVSYREFMNRDHYRKSLTAYGPHTADYMVTRLVRMAASLRGGDSFVPEAHDAGAQADEARMQGQSLLIGAASARAYDAWVAALPQDVGPVEPIEQPEAIQHFNAATFRWRGGSTQVDNPIVRIEKRCTAGDLVTPSEDAGLATAWVFKNCTAAGAGQWATFADMTGEVQTRAHFPEGFPGAGEVYAGQFTWEWTANFEAYRAFPARLGSTPVGIYRFVVQGCFNDGAGGDADGDGISRCPGRASEYSLSSAEFEVGPGEATPPRSYDSPAFAFFIDGSGTSVPCDHCSFRPWEGH